MMAEPILFFVAVQMALIVAKLYGVALTWFEVFMPVTLSIGCGIIGAAITVSILALYSWLLKRLE